MGKTFLHRLFGVGKIPKRMRPVLEGEGIILLDEGIGGSVTFRDFRGPWKRHRYARKWFTGSLVLTEKRFAAFQFSKALVNVPLEDTWLRELDCSLENESTLRVAFDPSVFHEGWSGSIECRFATSLAASFLEHLRGDTARRGTQS